MRVAFFLLQIASKDDASQKNGIQLVLQIFHPSKSCLLTSPPQREQFRRLFACCPVRFSVIHICVAQGPSSVPLTDEVKAADPSVLPKSQADSIIEAVASLFGGDEKIRTKYHSGQCRSTAFWGDCVVMESINLALFFHTFSARRIDH
jgi:hypothetical protein